MVQINRSLARSPSETSTNPAPDRQTQLKAGLAGKPYEEQAALLSPQAPVQKKAGESSAASTTTPEPSASAQAAPGQPLAAQQQSTTEPPAAGQPAATEQATTPPGAEASAGSAPAASGGGHDLQQEITKNLTAKRAAAAELVKGGKFSEAFNDLKAYEASSAAAHPDETKAALATLPPTREWLVDVIGLYLKSSPVRQEVLKEDKGPARGKDDKSAEITAAFVTTLSSLQSAVEASFPGDSARAVKEITVRRELFKLFAKHHDKSQVESGISSAASAVKGKLEQHVTSCSAYQPALLKQAFDGASVESSKNGLGKTDIKATTTHGWDMEKKRETKGPKRRNFGFFDSLGRAAKEVGAWTEGGPGLQPKAGDILIYLKKGRQISHIGFFKFAEECPDNVHQLWHTFDGGQPAGTPMTAAGFTQSVQDGALNNLKRSYDKTTNSIKTPSESELATLRGAPSTGGETKAKTNQDGELRQIGGVIDVGKLIELDKEPESPAENKAR